MNAINAKVKPANRTKNDPPRFLRDNRALPWPDGFSKQGFGLGMYFCAQYDFNPLSEYLWTLREPNSQFNKKNPSIKINLLFTNIMLMSSVN